MGGGGVGRAKGIFPDTLDPFAWDQPYEKRKLFLAISPHPQLPTMPHPLHTLISNSQLRRMQLTISIGPIVSQALEEDRGWEETRSWGWWWVAHPRDPEYLPLPVMMSLLFHKGFPLIQGRGQPMRAGHVRLFWGRAHARRVHFYYAPSVPSNQCLLYQQKLQNSHPLACLCHVFAHWTAMRRQLRSRRAPAFPYGYRYRLVSPREQNILLSLLSAVGWGLYRSWLMAASPWDGQ